MRISLFLRKSLAFLKRDFLINTSYKMSFLFDFCAIAFSVLTFFFIAKLFGQKAAPYLADYGSDYFPFVLIGIAFSGYLAAAMNSFTQTISEEQAGGTLEAIILSPTKISTLLICGSLWNFIFTSLRVAAYLLLGWLFFGFNLTKTNFAAALIILALTIISFSGLGIISASFILVFKKGDPINWFFNGISRFLGGVYFPVALLPAWLKKISYFLPITYSLEAMRKAIILGSSLKELIPQLSGLIFISIIFFPLGILSFKLALRKAKKDGSLLYS